MIVIKRDGSEQQFNVSKIQVAIRSAMREVNNSEKGWDETSLSVAKQVEYRLESSKLDKINIEVIQDTVEEELMRDYPTVAKAYILYREEHAEMRTLILDPNTIANYIHASKYAKYLPKKKRRETYSETVSRSMQMHIKRFPKLRNEIIDVFEYVHSKKVLPSMRSMQFGGQAIEVHNTRMYNCSFTLVDRPRVFQEIFYLLLCGCGVGFSVQTQHVDKLPAIGKPDKSKVFIHHAEDTIIGWADTVGLLFKSYEQGLYFEPCFDLIRPEGAMLKASGGKAPGHLPLKKVVERIRVVLDNAIGRKLRPIECHDIVCFIAEAVLAGGIRRSSLISLFSKHDDEMATCKTSEHFNYQGLNSQRAMANNSVVFLRRDTTEEEFKLLMEMNRSSYGEPGFMFTNDLDHGMNPCGEIGIDPTIDGETGFGFCNLCEINVAACETAEQLYAAAKAAAFIGTLQASYTDFPYLGQVTEQIVKRDALLGIGLTGIMDNLSLLSNRVLQHAAEVVTDENERVAKLININSAARCTTVKPSGTSSLELGCVASGIHPHHAHRYFRKITANKNESVAKYFIEHNPHMVERKNDGDLCLTFPVSTVKDAVVVSDFTAIQFMDTIFSVYDNWVLGGVGSNCRLDLTHNVSSTVVVAENEWGEVLDYTWENRNKIKAMSFFPKSGDKIIPFAPREEVLPQDEARWKFLIENYKPVDYKQMVENENGTSFTGDSACQGGACETIHIVGVSVATGCVYFTGLLPDMKRYEILDPWITVGDIVIRKARFSG